MSGVTRQRMVGSWNRYWSVLGPIGLQTRIKRHAYQITPQKDPKCLDLDPVPNQNFWQSHRITTYPKDHPLTQNLKLFSRKRVVHGKIMKLVLFHGSSICWFRRSLRKCHRKLHGNFRGTSCFKPILPRLSQLCSGNVSSCIYLSLVGGFNPPEKY